MQNSIYLKTLKDHHFPSVLCSLVYKVCLPKKLRKLSFLEAFKSSRALYLLVMVSVWFFWKGNVRHRHTGVFGREIMKISCRDVVPSVGGIHKWKHPIGRQKS